jgi:thiamine transport system permease protein
VKGCNCGGVRPRAREKRCAERSEKNPVYLLLLLLFYLPVLFLLGKVVLGAGFWQELTGFLRSELFWNTLSFSCRQAACSASFSLLLALPGAYFFGRFDFPGKRLLRSAMVLPFMLPGVLVVLGMVVFYGNNGALNHWLALLFPDRGWRFTGLYGFWGIILAHVFYNFTFCLRLTGEAWERINPALHEASALLGAGPFYTWRRVTLPLLAPTLLYLFLLVFLYSFLSFTVVLVLGGYLYKTFEVLIYIEYSSRLRFARAALIAIVQLLLLAGLLYLQALTGRRLRRGGLFTGTLPTLRFRQYPGRTILFLLYLAFVGFFFFSPLAAIVVRSFFSRGLPGTLPTLENYRLLLTDGFRFATGRNFLSVIATSTGLAVTVAFVTVSLAYYLARLRRDRPWGRADLWLQLPLGVSFVTFSSGLSWLAGRVLPSGLLILWAQLFLAFPLVYSMLRTARRELGESVLEAAALLGAPPPRILQTVELPLMRPALSTAAAYAAAFSLGDLAAVLMLGRGRVVTLSVAIYRLIGHYRFPQAIALGTIFILISLLLFLLMEGRSRPRLQQIFARPEEAEEE